MLLLPVLVVWLVFVCVCLWCDCGCFHLGLVFGRQLVRFGQPIHGFFQLDACLGAFSDLQQLVQLGSSSSSSGQSSSASTSVRVGSAAMVGCVVAALAGTMLV